MKNKILLGVLLSFGILAWGFGVSAETIFTDNFNSYNNAAVAGQGGWLGPGGTVVTEGLTREGAKSLIGFSFATPTGVAKSGALVNDGKITVYVRRFDANQPGAFSFLLMEGNVLKIEVRGNAGNSGRFQYVNGATASYVNFGPTFNDSNWYAVQIQWRSSDHSARYNIDGGTWTDWAPSIAPWSSGLDTVQLESTNAMLWDTIQENLIDSKTPVLIVPGLLGTELKRNGELLWVDGPRLLSNIGDGFMDPLSFSSNLQPSDSQVLSDGVLTSESAFDYMDSLIVELEDQGYTKNENLFTFPYDWRYGVTGKYADGKTNTDLLAEKIQEILAQTGSGEIDVIAHSMGGLILKKYVADNVADNHIGKAVFVGVPNTGAPKSVKTLLEGDNLGMFFVSQKEIKKISQNMPAMYDLLPSQQYYDAKGSYVKVIDNGVFATVRDLTQTETVSFLTGENGLNAVALSNAGNLHTAAFDNFDLRSAGVDVYAVDGCKAATIGKVVQVRGKDIFGQTVTSYRTPKMVPGDGTVPLESATNLPINAANKFYSLKGEHGKMMSQDGVRQQIVNIISGSELAVDEQIITQDIDECKLNGKAVSVFSPVNIMAVDQEGNKTGLTPDGSILNKIPNAAFEVMGEQKFLYLPTDEGQVYTISMDGMGTGTYTIKTEDIQNNDVVKTQVFSSLPVTADLTGAIQFGAGGVADNLVVKQNAASQPEIILPSPPEVIIQFDPVAKDLVFSSEEPSVTVTDQDDVITLRDQAGNVTEIELKYKNRKKKMSAEVVSLKYNGVAVDIRKTKMVYAWKLDKSGQLAALKQHVVSRKDYNILAEYDGQNTKISGKDAKQKISQTAPGLNLLQISTNKGDFDWRH